MLSSFQTFLWMHFCGSGGILILVEEGEGGGFFQMLLHVLWILLHPRTASVSFKLSVIIFMLYVVQKEFVSRNKVIP